MNSLCLSAISHFTFPSGNHKYLDNPCTPNFTNIYIVGDNGLQGCFFKIDREIPMELHDLVKNVLFLCISRPVPRNSLSPYTLSLVEDWGIHWKPSR